MRKKWWEKKLKLGHETDKNLRQRGRRTTCIPSFNCIFFSLFWFYFIIIINEICNFIQEEPWTIITSVIYIYISEPLFIGQMQPINIFPMKISWFFSPLTLGEEVWIRHASQVLEKYQLWIPGKLPQDISFVLNLYSFPFIIPIIDNHFRG